MRRVTTARRIAPLLGLLLWLVYPLAVAAAADIRWDVTRETGWYSNARWANSELIPQLWPHLAGIEYGKLYSNNSFVPYFHAAAPAVALPSNRSELRTIMSTIYQNPAATSGVYVLWVAKPPEAPLEYDRR